MIRFINDPNIFFEDGKMFVFNTYLVIKLHIEKPYFEPYFSGDIVDFAEQLNIEPFHGLLLQWCFPGGGGT